MRKLILAAVLAATIPGFQGVALAQGASTAPAGPSLAGNAQSARAQMLTLLELGGLAIKLDRTWDFMAVRPYNTLDTFVAGAQRHGLPGLGITATEANAAILRGARAGDDFAKMTSKTSPDGLRMIATLKDIFEK